MSIIRPEDFGAVGDGRANDAVAFWTALAAARSGDTVLLGEERCYYLSPLSGEELRRLPPDRAAAFAGRKAAIEINGGDSLSVKGKNTTVLIDAPLFYCDINRTGNLLLEGITFDYRIRPFAGAQTLSLDEERGIALVQTDRPLHIDGVYKNPEFGVLQRPDGRWHMFMESITPVDAAKCQYEIAFRMSSAETVRRLPMLTQHTLIVPMPYIGHRIERAFSIVGNRDFTMRDCRVYSMARFGFALFGNEGCNRFERLRVCRAPDESIDIVGWRDGFHVKENRGRFVWDSCEVEYLYDDVFNISASMLNVEEVAGPRELDLYWQETGGPYVPLRQGDAFTVFDYDTGALIGSSRVRRVLEQSGAHNRIELDDPLPEVRAGRHVFVCFDSMVAPNSVIKDCRFQGTFRFRGPIEITNTYFRNLRFWIDLEIPVEGPVPRQVHFTDCEFVCDDSEHPYFHIRSQALAETGKPLYHLEDIRFRNCKLDTAVLEISDRDRPYVCIE